MTRPSSEQWLAVLVGDGGLLASAQALVGVSDGRGPPGGLTTRVELAHDCHTDIIGTVFRHSTEQSLGRVIVAVQLRLSIQSRSRFVSKQANIKSIVMAA